MSRLWKKGRGKLGAFDPILGDWLAAADSPRGPMRCFRRFQSILDGRFLQLTARWEFGPSEESRVYEETAIIGPDFDGRIVFWSFTSDGKHSRGEIADVTDLHPEAIGFEADMPAGRARMAYWPAEDGATRFIVESKNRKGWNRFVDHTYHRF
ncbi:MAG: hypothetical protein SFX72_21505 [Isosphaeraceae bacterium]|nr:hypothetical protein [Isosphaeraceae bacterium]